MSIPFAKLPLAATCVALMTACSTVAPQYTPVPMNIVRLREAGLEPMKLGTFAAADPARAETLNHLTIRGGSYVSPYQGSYVEYLKQALSAELKEANLLDPGSAVGLAGFLVANVLDASGFSKANARMEARFQITRDGKVTFDKVLSARFDWDSNFMGAIAIPQAVQNYPIVVQQLLANLFADPDFIAALRKS